MNDNTSKLIFISHATGKCFINMPNWLMDLPKRSVYRTKWFVLVWNKSSNWSRSLCSKNLRLTFCKKPYKCKNVINDFNKATQCNKPLSCKTVMNYI